MSTSAEDFADLPDPDDHEQAWWQGEPAYLAWWRRLAETLSPADVWEVVHQQRLVARYADAIPCNEALEALAALGPLVEVGAGGGYWARLLRDRGGDVVAFDNGSWTSKTIGCWTAVQAGGVDALERYRDRALFVCWPPRPYGFMPDLLDAAPSNTTLALITDGPSTVLHASDPMYNRLTSDWTMTDEIAIPRWPARFDRLMVWNRR